MRAQIAPIRSRRLTESVEDRFRKYVRVYADDGSCWLWTGSRNPLGYGYIRVKSKNRLAHRLSYEIYNGEIPRGQIVRHTCDLRICVNPIHLVLGTYEDNTQDAAERGRYTRQASSEARFRCRVRQVGDCHIWTGTTDGKYGVFKVAGVRVPVHRYAWSLYRNEPLPEYVSHRCEEPLCVNPQHLYVGSTFIRKRLSTPDDIVRFMIGHPNGHDHACNKFDISLTELLEILEAYYLQ